MYRKVYSTELKSYVMVNHWGTVVVSEPIEGAENGVLMDKDDSTGCRTVSPKGGARTRRQQSETWYNYLGERMTLEEFASPDSPSPTMEQTM